jgi:hypothetical protein
MTGNLYKQLVFHSKVFSVLECGGCNYLQYRNAFWGWAVDGLVALNNQVLLPELVILLTLQGISRTCSWSAVCVCPVYLWKFLSLVLYGMCPDVFLGHMIALVVLMSQKGIVSCIFIDAKRMYVLCQGNTNFVLSHCYKCFEILILLLPAQKYTAYHIQSILFH